MSSSSCVERSVGQPRHAEAEPVATEPSTTRRPALTFVQQEGNASILESTLRSSRALLLAQARKHSSIPDDAEEALQSACALFIERFDSRYRPLPWLQTTVKREAWRIAKRAYRRHELGITAVPRANGEEPVDLSDAFPDLEADPHERACRDRQTEERLAALEGLKPAERLALILLGLGFSSEEIAAQCRWTLTKVNRCISEGRSALRARETRNPTARMSDTRRHGVGSA